LLRPQNPFCVIYWKNTLIFGLSQGIYFFQMPNWWDFNVQVKKYQALDNKSSILKAYDYNNIVTSA
jgi:hypothetical protein